MRHSMVERVSDAICEALSHWIDEPLHHKMAYDDASRAAIAAMREPTEWMVKSGQFVTSDWAHLTAESIRARWTSMIDAALSDDPNAPQAQGR